MSRRPIIAIGRSRLQLGEKSAAPTLRGNIKKEDDEPMKLEKKIDLEKPISESMVKKDKDKEKERQKACEAIRQAILKPHKKRTKKQMREEFSEMIDEN